MVNDIEAVIKLFADATSMYLRIDSGDLRAEILNYDLEKIMLGPLSGNFNNTKTELMKY